MRFFSIFALLLLLGASPLMAQATEVAVTEKQTNVDPEKQSIDKLMSVMINNYDLNHDQQKALKESGLALIAQVKNASSAEHKARIEKSYITTLGAFLDTNQYEKARKSERVLDLISDIVRLSAQ